jgi:hypothetical protein
MGMHHQCEELPTAQQTKMFVNPKWHEEGIITLSQNRHNIYNSKPLLR